VNPHSSTDPSQPKNEIPVPVEPSPEKIRLDVPNGKKLVLDLHLDKDTSADIYIHKAADKGDKVQTLHFLNETSKLKQNSRFQNPFRELNIFKTGWQTGLIVLALVIYLATRFISLDSFPIYFFTDEAVQTVQAADLVKNHFKSNESEFLPTYFENGDQYNLGTSVYLQVLPYLVFGKNIWVTRGVSVLVSLLAALALGLAMRNIFGSRQPYLAILFLSITPAWFLHSRTAFETVIAVSFYAAFLYCYLMYRKGHFKYIYAAAVFGALAFYSYSPAQMVMAVTVVGVFFSDLTYHWQNRKKLLPVMGLAIVFFLPYLRFLITYPDENTKHLQILNSYWIQTIPLWQKLGIYFSKYLHALNPYYWFQTGQTGIVRHLMRGYGNLLWWTFPLVLLGLALTLLRLKKPEYRVLLLVLLAAPSGAALVDPGVTRALFIVIPAALLAAIGVDQLIIWLSRVKVKPALTAIFSFALLAGVNGFMLTDALKNGPTWYSDYGLYGMQYGAKQVFTEIKEYLEENPGETLTMSSAWTNGTDVLARYFFNTPVPFKVGGIDQWISSYRPLDENNVFVTTPEEMTFVEGNIKFKEVKFIQTLPYPNGKPGFYFVKVAYVDNIQEIFAAEAAARKVPQQETITLTDGTVVNVKFPMLDMGNIPDAFDGNEETLIRTLEANPMVLKLTFTSPRPISQVTLRIGGPPTTMNLLILPADGSSSMGMMKVVPQITDGDYRNITFSLDKEILVSELTISVKNTDDKEPSHVHLWEVTLK